MALTSARLRAVNAVAEAGGFAAAARRLGMKQPSVAQNVRDLERAYGVLLFERRGGQLEPIPLCIELCAMTERIEHLEEEARRLLDRQGLNGGGELSIAMGNTMPGMALIKRFQLQHPGVEISAVVGSHHDVLRSVLGRHVDIGIIPDVPKDGRFVSESLLEQAVVAIVPVAHPLATKPLTDCATLVDERLIFRRSGSAIQQIVDRAFRRADLWPRPSLVLDSRDGVYDAVTAGLGIGFIWSNGTQRLEHVRRVRVAELSRRYDEMAFHLNEQTRPVVEAFMAEARLFAASAVQNEQVA